MNVYEKIATRLQKSGAPFENNCTGSLVKAISAIQAHYNAQGWTLQQSDIRKHGEHGIGSMHTETMEFKCSMEHTKRKIRARIHRTCSDVYIIDACEMI